MNDQMIRVISSPSSSTIGFLTLIFGHRRGDAIDRGCARITARDGQPSEATASATVGNHEVFNQPPPLEDYNLFDADRPLVEAVRREGAEWAEERIAASSARSAGCAPDDPLGRLANENEPKLRTHDRYGNRIDEVEFHPAWHELMRIGGRARAARLPWQRPAARRPRRPRRRLHAADRRPRPASAARSR